MRMVLVVFGLALGGALVFGRCPCEVHPAPPCSGNGGNYFQAFIDNSCSFPPNLLKVEWNGIFGSQSAWLPSVSQGRWRTNVFGVTWEAQRITDTAASGHWTVRWMVGASDFNSISPGSPSNCLASVSWSDARGSWSVIPCEWVQPTCQLLASTNYVTTIEFVGLVDPCGSPVLGGGRISNQQEFEYGRVAAISQPPANCPMFVQVNCPEDSGDRVSVVLVGDPPDICSSPDPCPGGRFVAAYSSPMVLTNVGTRIAGMIVSNEMYGTVGCDFDWRARGGYAVIRFHPKYPD